MNESATPAGERRSAAEMRRMSRIRRLFVGGLRGNEQLTAVAAVLLLVLLFVEGMTLLNLGALLTVHVFVGLLLIPVVALKLGSTGWRMLRYYLGAREYVERGPPRLFLRALVAPILILSTTVLFGTGTAILALGQTEGALVALHKASFILWFGLMTIHVLGHVLEVPSLALSDWRRAGGREAALAGAGLRIVLVSAALLAGLALALATISLAGPWLSG
jgi:hypothetical protein